MYSVVATEFFELSKFRGACDQIVGRFHDIEISQKCAELSLGRLVLSGCDQSATRRRSKSGSRLNHD